MAEYRTVGGKQLRYGYTTGTCATGAAKAAVMMLLLGKEIHWVDVTLPTGKVLSLEVTAIKRDDQSVSCAIVKDGGDDPDITHGLSVYCHAILTDNGQISIEGGEGVGHVTLPGLKIAVGEAAINPVPRQMINEAVRPLLPVGVGAKLLFSIPRGAEVALKTYNPRLGIVGGLSIIGTTGQVVPMSDKAWRDAIVQQLSMIKASGSKQACLVFGNYGEEYALNHLQIPAAKIVKISNYVGHFFEKSVEYGIEHILFIGHIGKLIKVSAGIFNTHSKVADARMEILVFQLAMAGAPLSLIEQVYSSKTTDGALTMINQAGYQGVYKSIANACRERCQQYTFGKINVACILFGGKDTALASSDNGREMLKDFQS